MTVITGAFNEILRPGLKEAWDEAYGAHSIIYKVSNQLLEDDLYGFTKRITGVEDVELGRPRQRGPIRSRLEDIPHAEDEWPPRDWP